MKLIIYTICLLAPGSGLAATYGQKIVAAVLMAEAWSEGETGMTAVAEVIRNRADAAQQSPLAIVTAPGQFSCLSHTTSEALYRKYSNLPEFTTALKLAGFIYNEPARLPGYSRGANHYTRTDERPYWARGEKPVAVIGAHSFYRLESSKWSRKTRASERRTELTPR